MFLVSMLLWTISIIIFVSDVHSESNRWGSLSTFLFGGGGFAVLIGDMPCDFCCVSIIKAVLSSLTYFLAPFTVLMYTITYSGISARFSRKIFRFITSIIALPVVLLYIFIPVIPFFGGHENFHLQVEHTRIMMFIVLPYYLITAIILLAECINEKDLNYKMDNIYTCLLIIPPTSAFFITSYLLPSFGVKKAWEFNVLIIIYEFSVFLFLIFYKGALGFRANLERYSRKHVEQVVIQSTGVMHHAIKNNLAIISMMLQKIDFNYKHLDRSAFNPENEIMKAMDTCQHLNDVMDRIRLKLQPISLKEELQPITPIIELALKEVENKLIQKSIKYQVVFRSCPQLSCDGVHLKESIVNLINNALEAMKENGYLQIETFFSRSDFVILIVDNGCGIPKNKIKKVGAPLFTTKSGNMNFGLGLYYVKQVIYLHKAQMKIRSAEGIGTTIELRFPKKKVIT
ncbi:MAG: HAMP domain-containing sensor histidine kinase [Bacillota bacterium]|nr:HAMP domain-containing sensor histidine kinase [Bacillota bacterium]